MSTSCWRVALAAWELDARCARGRRAEQDALEQIGRSFHASIDASANAAALSEVLAPVAELDVRARDMAERLSRSLENDRRDYRATSSEPGRWLVVVRGVLDRLVLRVEARRARRELPAHFARLGAQVVAHDAAARLISADDRRALDEARALQQRSRAERAALLEPFGGRALPVWLRVVLDELRTFFAFVRAELTKKFFLRLPALAAMLAAWWLARTYTSSSSFWNELRGDGRTSLSADTLARLSFWLPLFAAALVAYAMATLTKRVRRRYLTEHLTETDEGR